MQNYEINKYSVGTILNYVKNKDIAIPEIQRPFVWKNKQVRDLIDSLYRGFPVGYLIISQNPSVKLKDGTLSKGKKVLIDGQQRVTALMTSLLGLKVLDSSYKEKTVKIAFNPFAADEEDCFEVQDSSHLKSKKWIEDISIFFDTQFDMFGFMQKYCEDNPEITQKQMYEIVQRVKSIENRDIGVIELASDLDTDIVTNVFIRINSQGTTLSQADFAMSKIAADEKFGGNMLRKAIDYFCHLATEPSFYHTLETSDKEFMDSQFGKKVAWLKDDNSDIYDPSYEDMLRVSFIHMFSRGKLKDLVSLLSGRDFETKDYKEEIAEDSFNKLTEGILHFMHEYYFEQFVLAIKSAGFISSKLITSQSALDFAYVVYLKLMLTGEVDKTQIKHYVAKWFVMSVLTGRYSGSAETVMDRDIRNINAKGVVACLKEIEAAELSNAFWKVGLVQRLDTSSANSPALMAYFAAQIVSGDKGLFSPTSTVANLFGASDVHHIYPKAYLRKINALDNKTIYNQVANYTYLDTPVNIAVGDDAPNKYFKEAFESARTSGTVFGVPMTEKELTQNLKDNCIPSEIIDWDYDNYLTDFLPRRRELMAAKIADYYSKL